MAKSTRGFPPPREIEHPEAYYRAVKMRIQANKAKTNAKKLREAVINEPIEFKQWLGLEPFTPATGEACTKAWKAEQEAEEAYREEQKKWIAEIKRTGNKELPAHPECEAAHEALHVALMARHKADEEHSAANYEVERKFWKTYGSVPEFIRNAMRDWGGLTEKQLAYAKKVFNERIERNAGLNAKTEARKASVTEKWEIGRAKELSGTVVSVKQHESDFGLVFKMTALLSDNRMLYCSLPDSSMVKGSTFTNLSVTISGISDTDETFAFGKLPKLTKGFEIKNPEKEA